jgi:hypothetical protein
MTSLAAFLQASLAELRTTEPGRPLYETPLGALFDIEWRKGAKEVRRKEMKGLPDGLSLEGADESKEKTLDLADWEKDIVFTSM